MPSYYLHTSNDAEEIYTGKQVKLIVAQRGTHRNSHTSLQNRKITFFFTLTFTADLTAHCATSGTRNIKQAKLYVMLKREDQQDATIRCLLLTSVSTCFGHHYARNMFRQKLIINI